MSVYIDFDLKVVAPDRAQAFATIREARKVEGGTEYVVLATGTSGLLSDVKPSDLMRRAAEDAMAKLSSTTQEAHNILSRQGLL